MRLQPDRGMHAVIEPPSPILVPGVPDALQIDVYGYMRAPEASARVTDAPTMRQLVADLNSFRALPSGPLPGMYDDGSHVVLTFWYPDGSKGVVS